MPFAKKPVASAASTPIVAAHQAVAGKAQAAQPTAGNRKPLPGAEDDKTGRCCASGTCTSHRTDSDSAPDSGGPDSQ